MGLGIVPKFKIMVVDDETSILKFIKGETGKAKNLEFVGFNSPDDALNWANTHEYDVALLDYKMPGMNGLELIGLLKRKKPESIYMLMTGYGDMDMAIKAIRKGVFDFIQKPFESNGLNVALSRVLKYLQLKKQNEFLSKIVKSDYGKGEFIGLSDSILKIRDDIKLFAKSSAPVLITGETGVGKEIVSQMIHAVSKRGKQRFVAVNCSAYVETLIESELFGHEKGAFTGADRERIGKLELAGNGTVLLDEVCEIPMHIQVKLLRVLQEKEFERVGGNESVELRARIISATNRNIELEIVGNRFRNDLYYRLNTLHLHIPPLRERKEDIELLTFHFLKKFAIVYGKDISSIDDNAMKMLLDYSWPGNVRQLENAINYAVLRCGGNEIHKKHLSDSIFKESAPIQRHMDSIAPGEGNYGESFKSTIEEHENKKAAAARDQILGALEKNRWNKSKTARALGITRSQLVYRLDKYGLKEPP